MLKRQKTSIKHLRCNQHDGKDCQKEVIMNFKNIILIANFNPILINNEVNILGRYHHQRRCEYEMLKQTKWAIAIMETTHNTSKLDV